MPSPINLIDLVIFGAGGLGREVLQVVNAINDHTPTWRVRGFIDEHRERYGSLQSVQVGGLEPTLLSYPRAQYFIAVGDGSLRKKIAMQLKERGIKRFATLVHPSAWMGADVQLGPGTIVTAHVSMTTEIKVGNHVLINLNATIGHNCALGDYSTLSPGSHLSGNVTLAEGATLGTGAVVLPSTTVGAWATIGAGAVVTRPVPPFSTVVGVPARSTTPNST